ncbi:MAG: UDP-N-acetylmuramate dehydrogenase, partial [Clostridia bacterium]|nr:UDP-N-acetylmuramate dehydrogenase [Clostridia bacterium]
SSGISLMKVCRAALDNSLSGLECEYGIPGSVGGAVFMNAGAYGGEIRDIVSSVTHITHGGKIETLLSDKLDFGYRHSFYSDNDCFIISAEFKLSEGNFSEIKAKMDDLLSRRKEKQPLDLPSAGSTFKRPEGYYAGALIEECDLKGYTIGGAQVSEKHAGFIVNKSNATCADICNLIEHCRETVYEQTGIMLEPEVRFIT